MSSAVSDISALGFPQTASHSCTVIREPHSILGMQAALQELGRQAGQTGAMDDLAYFLRWLSNRDKAPWLVCAPGSEGPFGSGPGLQGAVLMYEHRVAGYGMRILASFDETGRRTLTTSALPGIEFSLDACRTMLREGAQCILLSFRHDQPVLDPRLVEPLADAGLNLRWATREKNLPDYLKIEGTLDETLAPMGMKTRKHMRYYMRRAANDLGATFVPNVTISLEDFLALNAVSAYRATDEVAMWRYASYSAAQDPVLYGLRDRDGRWLSLIGGLHAGDYMELFWQMNRDDLKQYSIGTAMRAFMLEHEITRGTRRFYVEGGTSHTMSNAFVHQHCTDLVILRDTPAARAIPRLVKRFVPPENPLHEFLEHTDLEWRQLKGRRR